METEIRLWRHGYDQLVRSRALRGGRALRRLARRGSGAPTTEEYADIVADRIRNRAAAQQATERRHTLLERRRRVVEGSAVIRSEPVRMGLATIPERRESLARVIAGLAPQVDELYVYLNRYSDVPDLLASYPNVTGVTGPDLGDRGKFAFLSGFSGFYFSVDDDIEYPPYYVDYTLMGLEEYGRRALVAWHGSVLREPFAGYYEPGSRVITTYFKECLADRPVHVPGTGCLAFHTDTLPDLSIPEPNLADLYVARHAQRLRVPVVVLAHLAGWATPIPQESAQSIYAESQSSTGSRLDVSQLAGDLVRGHTNWVLPDPTPVRARRTGERRLDHVRVDWLDGTGRPRTPGSHEATVARLLAAALDTFGVTTETDPGCSRRSLPRAVLGSVTILFVETAAGGDQALDTGDTQGDVVLLVGGAVPPAPPGADQPRVRPATLRLGPPLANDDGTVQLPMPVPPPAPAATFARTFGVLPLDDGASEASPGPTHGSGPEPWTAAIRATLPDVPILARPSSSTSTYAGPTPRLVVARGPWEESALAWWDLWSSGIAWVSTHLPDTWAPSSVVRADSPEALASMLPELYGDEPAWNLRRRAAQAEAKALSIPGAAALYATLSAVLRQGSPTS